MQAAPSSPTGYFFSSSHQKENIRPEHRRPDPGSGGGMVTPGTNNSYHYPMYHHEEGVGPKRGPIMVPPPMAPPPNPHAVGSSNTGTVANVIDKFAVPTVPPTEVTQQGSGQKELPTPRYVSALF